MDHHALLSLVISLLNAQNGICFIKIMRLEKLCGSYATTEGYSQLVNKPTDCANGSSSCIDLIFTSNTNLVTDNGVDPTLYKTCHHNLIFGKISSNIPLHPPFYRDIWDYKRANVEMIQKAITDYNWK